MNESLVFNRVAPHFYREAWNHVVRNLFTRCVPEQRPDLLAILEQRGHMQGMMRETGLGGMAATSLFFDQITENLSTEDSIRLLKNSPSFQIVKNHQNFALDVIKKYPQYKILLD